jgi:hypothetical protein
MIDLGGNFPGDCDIAKVLILENPPERVETLL